MVEIDWKTEYELLEKSYKNLEKVRKTEVIEDNRVLVERIEEQRKSSKDSTEEVENQIHILQQQYNDMLGMQDSIEKYEKKIKELENKISNKDKILKILIQHEIFDINFIEKHHYSVTVLCEKVDKPCFTVKSTSKGIEYFPQKGFAQAPEKIKEFRIISFSELESYCSEIERVFVEQE